ncbi:MAG TPA: HEAT repeat domain-containing protein [Candidatus Ozemobacteraceae bacterium]|nr:HEAT repeat domain-containing protein [Candidatus Ozemobacteraceae bacterium]
MTVEGWLKHPRELVSDQDPWLRRLALAELSRAPKAIDRELFEEHLFSSDPTLALPAFLGLRRLCPPPPALDETWRDLFGEAIDLLGKRASTGPLPLRSAAIQALAFAPGGVPDLLLDRLTAAALDATPLEAPLWSEPPQLPLIQEATGVGDPAVSMALLLGAALCTGSRVTRIARLLSDGDENRALPALLALQAFPQPELAEHVLPLVRSPSPRLAAEAARALLACGGKRVFVLLLSLVADTSDPARKAFLLPLVARTGRPEVWNVLTAHLGHVDARVRRAATVAIAGLAAPAQQRATALAPRLSDRDPGVAAEAARVLWPLGSMEALARLEEMLRRPDTAHRSAAAEALGGLPPAPALPLLVEHLARERHGDVLRALLLSLRRLVPRAAPQNGVSERLLPTLRRLLDASDPFLRSQTAVLAGMLGTVAEDLVLSSLERPEHPHVLASLLGALRRIGSSRLLVLARFSDHPDPRVRANLMETLLFSGPGAIPYLTNGLRDPAPRVRAAAARGLFQLGQLEVVPLLTRMLLIPSPVPVLSACHALGQLMRLQPPAMKPDHPLPLSLSREARRRRPAITSGPPALRDASLASLFEKLSTAAGDPAASARILEQHLRMHPTSYATKRLLAAVLAGLDKAAPALSLVEACLAEQPGVLADLLDAYRLAMRLGDLPRAERLGHRVRDTYGALLDACLELAHARRGGPADQLLDRLFNLREPSMNLYSAMIQLKAGQGDSETVLELLTELLLARPGNAVVAARLATHLPSALAELKTALALYARSLQGSPSIPA